MLPYLRNASACGVVMTGGIATFVTVSGQADNTVSAGEVELVVVTHDGCVSVSCVVFSLSCFGKSWCVFMMFVMVMCKLSLMVDDDGPGPFIASLYIGRSNWPQGKSLNE